MEDRGEDSSLSRPDWELGGKVTKYKRCPFCGKDRAEAIKPWTGPAAIYFVRCRIEGCKGEDPVRKTRSGAVRAWNRRPLEVK